ncbi:MAG: CaiB/BaiF CoA-transferase family protein [Beijerinckiaceae bacterium]|nr:CaiB/BaiF CoA-transferase family protein [Beijerinckiaceae bacterium]
MPGPLSHLRVLDLSRIMAGPWSTQILADLGADVIKVERPLVGDDTRTWGPPFLKDKSGADTKEAGYYLSVNRGKRSIALELDKPEGQAIVKALAERSDIVVENFKVGTLKKFGLDYEALRLVNPKLIYASITGFGQTGPKKDNAAYDFMIQAMGGLMSVTGEPDGAPGGKPQKVGVPITDIMTGMYAAIAVLAAVARRTESGEGEYIDIGMLDVQVSFLANQAMNYLVSGRTPQRTGNAHPNIQPQDVFKALDGYLVLVVGNDGQFGKFCDVVGRPELVQDERFQQNSGRVRNRPALAQIINEILATQPIAHWISAFDVAGVPAGPINTIPMVFEDEQVRHRNMLTEAEHPLSGVVPLVASPMKFSACPLAPPLAPPLLGQHTHDILREIGWS